MQKLRLSDCNKQFMLTICNIMQSCILLQRRSIVNQGSFVSKAKRATQAIFLVFGFGIASRAVMVPCAKERLVPDDGSPGLLLLLLIYRFGSRIIILIYA